MSKKKSIESFFSQVVEELKDIPAADRSHYICVKLLEMQAKITAINTVPQKLEAEDVKQSILSALSILLDQKKLAVVRLLFSEVDSIDIFTQDDICMVIEDKVKKWEETKHPNLIELRELLFEMEPFNIDNDLKLVAYHALHGDDLKTHIYAAAATEALLTQKKIAPYNLLTILFEKEEYTAFFQLSETIAIDAGSAEAGAFFKFLALLASHYCLDYKDYFEEKCKEISPNLLYPSYRPIIYTFTRNVFRHATSASIYAVIGEGLEKLADNPDISLIQKIKILLESISYYSSAALSNETKRITRYILQYLPKEKIEEIKHGLDKYDPVIDTLSWSLLFRLIYEIGYTVDDITLLRTYQSVVAGLYSRICHYKFSHLANWKRNNEKPECKKPIRVGYAGNSLRSHSVGILSHQLVSHHNRNDIEIYCYLWGVFDTSSIDNDPVYQHFREHAKKFYNLSPDPSVDEAVTLMRNDNLDVFIHLDSLGDALGNQILSLRVAPVQISWLGGDSSGIPETDYFMVDPYVLPESAQDLYSEKLIRLSSFVAANSFPAHTLDMKRLRQRLNISDKAVIYWSSANSKKRSLECIEAQLDILQQVPNGVLVVKGVGDLPSVIKQYNQIAEKRGITDRIRYLAYSETPELHRGELQLADIFLDTFPYTGATQTMEALWMGVPVLTRVGEHYYGRMSYSILSQIKLEECITYTREEYIRKGVILGQNREMIMALKERIKRSKKWSILWNPRVLCRELESELLKLVSRDCGSTTIGHKDFTTAEWNIEGLKWKDEARTSSLASERFICWEKALNCWRQGIAKDETDLLCLFNYIYAHWVLGERVTALSYGEELWKDLILNPERFHLSEKIDESQILTQLAWSPSFTYENENTSTDRKTDTYLYYLTRWLAENRGLVYRPEPQKYWRLASILNPMDWQAKLIPLLNEIHRGNIESVIDLKMLHKRFPRNTFLSLAIQILDNRSVEFHEKDELVTMNHRLPYLHFMMSVEPSLDSVVTFTLLCQQNWFESEIDLCKHIITPGMKVIDVGANLGVYTLLFASLVGDEGEVFAFEPTPTCIEILTQTIDDNSLGSIVALIPVAVGNQNHSVELTINDSSAFNSVNSDQSLEPEQKDKETASLTVDQVSLDEFWKNQSMPIISFIKIDAEGSELKVMQGAETLIKHCQPLIMFENSHAGKLTGDQCMEYLVSFDYEFFEYNKGLNALVRIRAKRPSALNIIAATKLHQPKLRTLLIE
jgi:FkbM family methyltransferase